MNEVRHIIEIGRGHAVAGGRRFAAAVRRIATRRPRIAAPVGPRSEQPSFVVAVGLVAAFAALALLDPLLHHHPGLADGSLADTILTAATSFGEGVEILVGSGVAVLVLACLDVEGLARRLRARILEVAATFGFAFASVAGSGLLCALIKNLYGRVRPEHLSGEAVMEIHLFAARAKFAAFPSGHATTAGATAMVLALIFPRWRRSILIAGAAVALTRIALGAHFFSDVAAGFALGAAVTLIAARALARRGLVFAFDAAGALRLKPRVRPAAWFDLLADLLAARRTRPRP